MTVEMTAASRRVFHRIAPMSIMVIGDEVASPRYFGDNMGARPAFVEMSPEWYPRILVNADRYSARVPRKMFCRLWVFTQSMDRQANSYQAQRLSEFVAGYLKERGEQLRHEWLDFGADVDTDIFESEIKWIAERNRIIAMNDTELIEYMEGIARDQALREAMMV